MSKAVEVSTAIANSGVLIDALPGVTVVERKTPVVAESDALPLAVVSVGEEGDVEYLTARKVMVTYPCAVTLVTAQGFALADNPVLRTAREAVRKGVEAAATFAGVAGFNAVNGGGKEPYDRAALAKDLDYSSLVFRVEVIEDRR